MFGGAGEIFIMLREIFSEAQSFLIFDEAV